VISIAWTGSAGSGSRPPVQSPSLGAYRYRSLPLKKYGQGVLGVHTIDQRTSCRVLTLTSLICRISRSSQRVEWALGCRSKTFHGTEGG
jgi:hypothetical protein